MLVEVYTDGGSRGNPGDSGYGFVVYVDSIKRHEGYGYLGKKTNNEAEYSALVEALKWVIGNLKLERVKVYADSQLMIKQLKGEYKVKAPTVKPLHTTILELVRGLDMEYVWIRREENLEADMLANRAMDSRSSG